MAEEIGVNVVGGTVALGGGEYQDAVAWAVQSLEEAYGKKMEVVHLTEPYTDEDGDVVFDIECAVREEVERLLTAALSRSSLN